MSGFGTRNDLLFIKAPLNEPCNILVMSGFGTRNDLLFIKAPLNDMWLLELVTNCPRRTIAKTARDTFSRHLWYFSEMLVGLSFFNDRSGAEM